MKPVNSQSISKTLVAWIKDFKNDNGRFPSSLDDFINNKNPRHDYDPGLMISCHKEDGYNIIYKLSDGAKPCFELSVQYKNDEPCLYKSSTV